MEERRASVADDVAAFVARGIASGRFRVGSRLPAERELAREVHASRGSVRSALAGLRRRGLVAPAPQSGWFVMDARLSEPVNTLISFTEMATRRALTPRTEVLSHVVRPPTFEEVEALSVPVGESVLDVTRLRRLHGDPVCTDRSLIALSRVPGIADVDLTDVSLYEQMTRLGAPPHSANFTVEAAGASAPVAYRLGIAEGAPVLITDERGLARDGTVLLCGRSVYRANAYRFHAELRRH